MNRLENETLLQCRGATGSRKASRVVFPPSLLKAERAFVIRSNLSSPSHNFFAWFGIQADTQTHTRTACNEALTHTHTHQPHWGKNYPKEKDHQGVFLFQQRKYCCSRKQSGSQQRIHQGREATFEGKQLKTKSCACRRREGNKVLTTFNVNRTQLNACSLGVASYSNNSWCTMHQLTVLLALLQHSYHWIFVVRGNSWCGRSTNRGTYWKRWFPWHRRGTG